MTHKEAKQTAAARGFASVAAMLKANRAAAREFRGRLQVPGEDKDRLRTLIETLDREYARFRNLA